MAVRVTQLPATKRRFTSAPIDSVKRRRAAAYARVSSDHADQLTSYAAQVDYYRSYIQSRSDLDFVNIYADEGITGTSTTHRKGFKQMISDALDGKIDLIITKSVSRFARNTVDSLSTIRLLREHGVECYFERENIRTFDSKGELLLTIMSSIAQEEARSISENCTWGQRRRFAEGKVTVPFSRFLGYDRGSDGNLIINEEEAEIVRRIYELFLSGETPYGIAKLLTADRIPTPGGKEKWSKETVRSILTNEKYKGDALLQKVFTVDFLTKRKKVNEGEVPQYYVEGNHEGIVSEELFDAVQAEFDRRDDIGERECGAEIFSSKIVCGECGEFFVPKVWYSTNKFRKVIWRCCRRSEKCACPHLVEAEIKRIFVKAMNKRDESGECAEFDEERWLSLVERVVVYDKSNIAVTFKDGEEIRVEI